VVRCRGDRHAHPRGKGRRAVGIDIERLLISKIIAEGNLADVTDAGINPTFFLDPNSRRVYATILRHKTEYGDVPTVRVMRKDFPDYKFVEVDESLQYLVDEIRKNHALSIYEEALGDAVEAYEAEDEDAVRNVLSRAIGKVAADLPHGRDTDITQTGQKRLERYKALEDLDGGLRGIPSGFASIDRATQGFQKGQLVTFVGPPKAGKSTTLLLAARAAHRLGYSPLFIGFEMSNEEQEERFDAIEAGVSHHRLRGGTLKPDEWKRLQRSVHSLEEKKPFVLSNDSMSTTTLSGVAAKIERYEPDIVFVDGVYMMDDENGEAKGSPQALTNITRGFKRMAHNMDIPIAITTQVLEWKMDRKQGVTSNSIGYSSSFAQDSDAVIANESTDDPTIKKIKIVIARNAQAMETFVQWDWETGTFEELKENPFETEGEEGYEAEY
jgi:replicative DNA helicase